MKSRQLPRRIVQYIIGIVCMAVGLVLLKRTVWGVSPITAVPDAVANITPLTLGNATILLHAICVVLQIVVQKRVTLKSLLTMCVGVPFGYLVDLFMYFWHPQLPLWGKIVSLVCGIAIQGFGVALISGCDMMLPAPDEDQDDRGRGLRRDRAGDQSLHLAVRARPARSEHRHQLGRLDPADRAVHRTDV